MRIVEKLFFRAVAIGLVLIVSVSAFPAGARPGLDRQAGEKIESASDIGKITITRTGVLSRKKLTVIRYRKSDLAIIGVTDNGREIPADQFETYRGVLTQTLEHPRLRELLARIDQVQKALDSGNPLSPELSRQLGRLFAEVDAFASRVSPANKIVIESRRDRLSQAAFHKAVSALLTENKLAASGDKVRLVIRPTGCAVNHRSLSDEISKEVHRIWRDTGRTEIQKGDTIIMEFDIRDKTEPDEARERDEAPAALRVGFEPSPDQIH